MSMLKRKKFCVLGQDVTIEYSSKPIVDDQGRYLAGFFDIKKNHIVIHTESEKETMKTLIHELTHSIIYRSGVAQIITIEAQEILCESMSHFIYENFDLRRCKRK